MAERAGIRKEYRRHFQLDETKLRRIADVLREHAQKTSLQTFLRFRVEREDNSFYESDGVDDVLADDNAQGRAIRSLRLELRRARPDEQAPGILGRDDAALATVSYERVEPEKVRFSVSGENRDWCFLLADELDSQIQRTLTKATLPTLPRGAVDIFAMTAASFGVLLLVLYLCWRGSPGLSREEIEALDVEHAVHRLLLMQVRTETTGLWFVAGAWLAMMGLLLGSMFRPVSRLMEKTNMSVFHWGDMVPAYERLQRTVARVKWGLGIAFIVSVLAGLVTSFLVG